MINLRSLPLCVLAGVAFTSIPALAQQIAPAARIVNQIDESQLVTLSHTVHPLANAANDRGVAPDAMQLDRMQIVLQRSPAQETALHQFITQMHTPGSPSYHQWLTPAQFGTQFGASDQDISTIETWLGNHGFSVKGVNPGKGTLEFSGSVAQMRDAFHTQIHKYVVNGETHYANANDPQIPAALAPVIGGFASLNNFRVKNNARILGKASYDPKTGLATPQWTIGPGSPAEDDNFVLSPADYAIQYDLKPLYTAGINGSGQTIAIVNDSNINVDLANQFRTLFGLPANPPQVIIDGNDPGVDGVNDPDGPNYDSGEAYLDVEWSGAVAPDATIDLVTAADTALEGGLELAAERAVYGNVAPVISLSFGACEADLGIYNQYFSSLWEQAAAQGQTVMVSTGDSGSAGCDRGTDYAVNGQAVNGFASTPYNVAVGGTDFYYSDYASTQTALDDQLATYWTTTPSNSTPAVSILGVIPEQPWNDSQFGLNIFSAYADSGDTATSIAGGSGGASNAGFCAAGYNTSTGACNGALAGYPKPTWQANSGVTGASSDSVRDIPDVSLFAANGYNDSYYPECYQDGDCQTGGSTVQISGVGGTSASAPSFAGIMALVNQKYGRQGQADFVLYPLKAQFPAAFHDITNGSNSVPCEFAPTDTKSCITAGALGYDITDPTYGAAEEGQIGTGTTPEYNAAAGYNLATGLGTVDANVLVSDWNKITFKSTSMTLTPSSTSFTHGTAVTISGSVTATTGTPTGNVALMTNSTESGEQGVGLSSIVTDGNVTGAQSTFALTNGSFTGSVSTLPGGTYDIWGQYGGDGTYAMITSTPVSITVTPEASALNLNIVAPESTNGYFTASSAPGNQVDYGTQLNLSALVAPSSKASAVQTCVTTGGTCPSFTAPTGVVKFLDNASTINTAAINAEGEAEFNAPFAVGAHSITATYAGDSSYSASPAVTAIPFTVVKDTPNMEVGYSAASSNGDGINGPDQPLVFTVVLLNGIQSTYASSTAVYPVSVAAPTGTVTASGFPSGVPTSATLSAEVDPFIQGGTQAVAGVASFIVPAGTTSGNYNVTICYPNGDSNYVALTGANCAAGTITISNTNGDGYQTSVTTAAISGTAASPNAALAVTGTVTGTSGHAAPTGGIYVYAGGYYITAVGFSSSSGVTSNFSFLLNSQTLIQGSNQVTLQYSGDTVYNPSAYTLNAGNPISSPLSDFSLIPDTTIVPISISSGTSSSNDTINVASVNGFTGTVDLTCAATTPLTCTISPNPALTSQSSSTATLAINVPGGTANGNYNVLVTGKDAATGEYIHTLAITADVTGSTPGFALTNSGNITVIQGATGNTSTISATPSGGFTGTVNLSCAVTGPTGATSPVTCSIPSSVDITGATALTATLTASSTATTTTGTYVITVTGTSGTDMHTTTVNITVTAAAAGSYALTNSGPISLTPGATTGNTSTISVTPSGGFTGTVTMTCQVTGPTGANDPATCSLASSSVMITGTTAQTDLLTISTTAATSSDLAYPKLGNGKGWLGAGSGALLALLVFFGIPARRRSWRSMLGILVALAVMGAMASCGGGGGGGGGGNSGTTPGSYTVTVTGTSGTLQPTTIVSVTVN